MANCCVLYFYTFFVPTLNLFFSTKNISLLSFQSPVAFIGSAYGLFILLGHIFYVNKERFLKSNPFLTLIKIASLVGLIFLTVRFQIYMHSHYSYLMESRREYLNLWYDFLLLPLIAFLVFSILIKVKKIATNFFIKQTARLSFGIYLVHRPIQMLFEQENSNFKIIRVFYDFSSNYSPISQVFIHFIVSFVISFIIVLLISYIPFINRILFRIK